MGEFGDIRPARHRIAGHRVAGIGCSTPHMGATARTDHMSALPPLTVAEAVAGSSSESASESRMSKGRMDRLEATIAAELGGTGRGRGRQAEEERANGVGRSRRAQREQRSSRGLHKAAWHMKQEKAGAAYGVTCSELRDTR